jgi:hypothetical protein
VPHAGGTGRASITFHPPGAVLPRDWEPPSPDQLAPTPGFLARIRMAASKADQTGVINSDSERHHPARQLGQ